MILFFSAFCSIPCHVCQVLAVKKAYLLSIGNYDEDMEADGGGENLELSLRTWMCGGFR